MKLNQNVLQEKVAQFIGAIQHSKDDRQAAQGEGQKALVILREIAANAASDGLNEKAVAEYVGDMMKAAGVPMGTIKPYRLSYVGFHLASANGENITAWKKDAQKRDRPMNAKEAREYAQRANETPTEKAIREADERRKALRAAIMQRVNAVKDERTLQAILDSDVLPALPEGEEGDDAEQRAEKAAETRQERERREAEEAARVALQALFESARDEAAEEPAQAAQA